MLPSASDLAYFIEVANTLNVSRAAERLGISQPSLSLAIQRLEGLVGTEIFTRSKRGVNLTQAGKQLLARSKQLLQSWSQLKSEVLASVNEIQGSYTVGCHTSVALYSLSGFLPKLIEEYPKLDIKLRHDLSRKITEEVISAVVDVGIAVNPIKHPDLIIHRLCEDEVTLWGCKDKLAKSDVSEGEVLICDPDLFQSQTLIKQLKKNNIAVKRIICSSSLEVIADLAANGCGIGILPSRVAKLYQRKKLTRVPKAPIFYDELCLLFRVENKNVKSIQTLNKAIRQFFEKEPKKRICTS